MKLTIRAAFSLDLINSADYLTLSAFALFQ